MGLYLANFHDTVLCSKNIDTISAILGLLFWSWTCDSLIGNDRDWKESELSIRDNSFCFIQLVIRNVQLDNYYSLRDEFTVLYLQSPSQSQYLPSQPRGGKCS